MQPFNLKDIPRNLVESNSDPNFRCFLNAKDDGFEIKIDDYIGEDFFGEGITAKSVVEELDGNPGAAVDVRINSAGGLVYDGFRIFNALLMHDGTVTTINEGLAFSSAATIFMAGDTRKVYPVSEFGIHRASGFAWGNAKTMRAEAQWLDAIDSHLVDDIYAEVADADQINQWLDGEDYDGTVFTARQALDLGFATEMIETKKKPQEDKKQSRLMEARNAAARRMIHQRRAQLARTR